MFCRGQEWKIDLRFTILVSSKLVWTERSEIGLITRAKASFSNPSDLTITSLIIAIINTNAKLINELITIVLVIIDSIINA